MRTAYKPATAGAGSPARRVCALLLAAAALIGAGILVDRRALPHPDAVPPPGLVPVGIRYIDGVPTGFPATVRGAGDAAAWYETLLADRSAEPADQLRALITALVAPRARAGLVEELMPGTGGTGGSGIAQTLIARVWAAHPDDGATLTPSATVAVETYGAGLSGPRTGGDTAGPDAGLAGGWEVHQLLMEWTPHGWTLARVDTPVPVPGPDVRGCTRDGSVRDTQALARVLGPDSWVPGMP
jgi:hypothetical protein